MGAARSGTAVARLLAARGARVLVSEQGTLDAHIMQSLQNLGVRLEVGGHTPQALEANMMVLSPGVPGDSPVPHQALRDGIPVFSELEVASWFCRGTLVAITGSNGKTTTTSMLAHALGQAGHDTVVAGNIGTPLSEVVPRTTADSVLVIEVSSFQLDFVESFRPAVSVLLNITPDHLDRYQGDFRCYATSKLRLTRNQRGPQDVFIFNDDDPEVRAHAQDTVTHQGVRTLPFSRRRRLDQGAFVEHGRLVLAMGSTEEVVMPLSRLAIPGPHNVQNAMAAALAARVLGTAPSAVASGLAGFGGVAHRLEMVREIDGVRYVNDSKATNVHAVQVALQSFSAPVVLLAGGRDKGNDYAALKPLLLRRVRTLVAFGESRDKVARELGPHANNAVVADTLEEAAGHARRRAEPGDVVLLSPACSSFDLFRNFEHRGDVFKALVNAF